MDQFSFKQDAKRLANKYMHLISINYQREKNIREKYNALTLSSAVHIKVGYKANVTGFG